MALKITILSLLGLVAVVCSNPLGFGFEVGAKSQLGGGGSAGGNVGAGIDEGLNGGARGEAEVHGSWIKSLIGKVYVAKDDGKGIGLGGSLGSDLGAAVNGSAAIAGDTIIVTSNGGARTGLDGDAHYRAGGNVHLLRQDEIASALYNARKFTDTQNEYENQNYIGEANRVQRPKYTKWLD